MKILNLKNEAQVLNYHLAELEINGRKLEMGLETASHQPMVIDWERRRAWVGTWEELLADVAEILEGEPADAATAT